MTPRSTTSRSAAVNSRVSSGLMKRESDCSSTSSWRNPSSWETASLACRILPSRSDTNTGSGAFAMMMSASSEPRDFTPMASLSTMPRCVRSSACRAIAPSLYRTAGESLWRPRDTVKGTVSAPQETWSDPLHTLFDARFPRARTCRCAPTPHVTMRLYVLILAGLTAAGPRSPACADDPDVRFCSTLPFDATVRSAVPYALPAGHRGDPHHHHAMRGDGGAEPPRERAEIGNGPTGPAPAPCR